MAGLNNGLEGYTWVDKPIDPEKGYASGGVERFPSIVKYPNGTYAVLTNTDQKIHYSVVETETINGEPMLRYVGDLVEAEPVVVEKPWFTPQLCGFLFLIIIAGGIIWAIIRKRKS